MGAGTITMCDTRQSLLARVRNPKDGRSWDEFDAIYRPLIIGYLRSMGLKEHDARDLTQDVFRRLLAILPTFELNPRKGRFRTYLWKLTYNTLVDTARRRKVRDRAEEEWVRRFSREADETESRKLEEAWTIQHRKRILEVVLPRVRETTSRTAWACFEARLVHRRPAAELAAKLGITANVVYVYASRVLQEVRRRCAEIEGELGDDRHLDVS
jgi:RNA polymerase sigma-70 factor (ECF subfamily)